MSETAPGLHQELDLDALIPAPSVADGYVRRDFPGGFTEFDTYEAALASGHNVLIKGPTGSGKTFSWRAFAAYKGLPFYTVAMNGALDMAALLGSWVPDASGGLVWQDGVITTMMRQRRGVVLIDEINMAIERNLARFYNLLDARREIVLYEHHGEVVRVPADEGSQFLVGAAYNPGYRGTRELSEALPNRFAFKMKFDYDPVIEAQLVPSDGIREVAERLRGMNREIRTPVSTNMLIEFCEIAVAFSTDYAVQNFVEAFPEDGEAESVTQVMGLYRDRLSKDIEALVAAYDTEGN